MRIQKDTVVSLEYRVWDTAGQVVDTGRDALVYLHGGHDEIFPAIEQALEGKAVGDTLELTLTPAQAFGEYAPGLVSIEARWVFPPDLVPGQQFEVEEEGGSPGNGDIAIYRVCEIHPDKVVLDGNHPLAGMTLVFGAVVSAVRAARPEELAARRVIPTPPPPGVG